MPSGEEEEASSEEDEQVVEEGLEDAVEGALRLKRLLSEDEEAGGRKRRKKDSGIPAAVKVAARRCQAKWNLVDDIVTKYVLENITAPDLEQLGGSSYVPDTSNVWKTPAELIQTHANIMREARTPGGGPLDVVLAFRHYRKLDLETEKLLRGLNHRQLRHVLETFDGTATVQEVVDEVPEVQDEDEDAPLPASSVNGVLAMSRYSRMEIVDPMDDAAVFGDANLSFCLNLAEQRKALGHVGRVISTTFENLTTLQERYKEIGQTIETLEGLYSDVYHSVDCTRVALDMRFKGMQGTIGAVYYNFPHAGAVGGFFDGHPLVNWRHDNLMRLFFRALRFFVKPGGTVKVASNSGAVGVRFSYITRGASDNEFVHVETLPFLQWHLHRYGRSYGDRRDTYKRPGEGEQYNAQRADSDMVYSFVYRPTGKTLPPQHIRRPPSMKTIMACTDGPFANLQGDGRKRLATELYSRFVTEISGTHVG